MSPVCPYCKGAIAPELARFGGRCPHCMLEVPGEDAPTDPGALLRAKQELEARERAKVAAKKKQQRLLLGAVGGAVALLLVGVLAWRSYEARTYTVGEYFQFPMEEIAAAPPVEEPAATAEPVPGSKGSGAKPPKSGSNGAVTASTGGVKAVGATAVASTEAPPPVPSTVGLPGTITLGGSTIDVSRPDLVLSDQDQITEMARMVMSRSAPQLQACYQQRLKQVPDLAGVWDVSFIIQTSGATSDVKVAGTSRKDPELESCMARAVGGWKFTRIARALPVSRPYRFRSAGG